MQLTKASALIAAILLQLTPVESRASNWIEIGGNAVGTVFVDKQSLRRSGIKVKVWAKWVYAKPEELKGSFPRQTYQATKDLKIYNCTERTTVLTQSAKYGTVDMSIVVENLSAPDVPSRYSEVAPDSIDEAILEFACREATQVKSK